MSDCLWNDIDNFLLTTIAAELGPSGLYATLQLTPSTSVWIGPPQAIGFTMDPDHVTWPFCLIRGETRTYGAEGPHGDGELHYDNNLYHYQLIFVTKDDTVSGCKADSSELLRRGRELLRDHIALDGLASNDGETVTQANPTEERVTVRGMNGTNQGAFVGFGVLELEIMSEL